MTEEIKARFDAYKNDDVTHFDVPTKELACAWLDSQIEYHQKLDELKKEYCVPLVYGDLNPDKGVFAVEIVNSFYIFSSVMYGVNPNLTIYSGIEKLAEIIGEELKVCKYTAQHPFCYWFKYGKYIIDQLEQMPLDGVNAKREDWL